VRSAKKIMEDVFGFGIALGAGITFLGSGFLFYLLNSYFYFKLNLEGVATWCLILGVGFCIVGCLGAYCCFKDIENGKK